MSIVSSTISKNINIGYAKYIEETHTDSTGIKHIIRYQCPQDFDINSHLSDTISSLSVYIADQEADRIINNG